MAILPSYELAFVANMLIKPLLVLLPCGLLTYLLYHSKVSECLLYRFNLVRWARVRSYLRVFSIPRLSWLKSTYLFDVSNRTGLYCVTMRPLHIILNLRVGCHGKDFLKRERFRRAKALDPHQSGQADTTFVAL